MLAAGADEVAEAGQRDRADSRSHSSSEQAPRLLVGVAARPRDRRRGGRAGPRARGSAASSRSSTLSGVEARLRQARASSCSAVLGPLAERRGRAGEVDAGAASLHAEERQDVRSPGLGGRRRRRIERIGGREPSVQRVPRCSSSQLAREDPVARPPEPFELARGERARRVSARTGSCTSAAMLPALEQLEPRTDRHAAEAAGSSTVPPPSVVRSRRTTWSPRAATTGEESRSCAKRSPRGRRGRSARRSRGGRAAALPSADVGELLEDDVEPVADRIGTRLDERIAATELAPLDPRQRDRDPLAGLGPLDGRVVHLDAPHAHIEAGRFGAQGVALADRARPEGPRDDGPDPPQREDAVDEEPRRAVRSAAARPPPQPRRGAARSSSRPAPVFALVTTTWAPGTSSRASSTTSSTSLWLDGVHLRHRDDAHARCRAAAGRPGARGSAGGRPRPRRRRAGRGRCRSRPRPCCGRSARARGRR